MRKVAGTLLAVAIAAVGVVGLIAFFNSRDDSTTGPQTGQPDPGVTAAAPASGAGLLEAGNVVLTYSDPAFTAPLTALASDLGAPDSPALRAGGQAIVLRRDAKVGGVRADAHEHTLTVAGPGDARLQEFIERWLGLGARR